MAVKGILPAHARRAHPLTGALAVVFLSVSLWGPIVLWAVGA